MNFKNINKLILLSFFLFINSCKILDLELIKNSKNTDIGIINEQSELSSVINLPKYEITSLSHNDFYDKLILSNINNDYIFKKLITINTFEGKYKNTNSLIKFIEDNKIFSLDSSSNFNIYDLNNYKLLESLPLNSNKINKKLPPTSIAKLNDLFYVSYSDGTILSFDENTDIKWLRNLNEITKTPIKIFDDNLIILSGDSIKFINPINGSVNLQYKIKNNNPLQSIGGDIIELNHFIFFNLPNNEFGQIDTLFGEKITNNLADFDTNNKIRNYNNKLHSFNNYLSFFNENKLLTTVDMVSNNFLLKNEMIPNIDSFKFFNNSLIVLTKNKLLKSYNILNKNVFWDLNIDSIINNNDNIIDISSHSENLIIFFKSGKFIVLNKDNGKLILQSDINIDNIIQIKSYDDYFYVDQKNGKTTFFIK